MHDSQRDLLGQMQKSSFAARYSSLAPTTEDSCSFEDILGQLGATRLVESDGQSAF
jgi:hypothetical protein